MSRYPQRLYCILAAFLPLLAWWSTGCASRPESGVRFYELEGARNFRDFGGYKTEQGHQVSWGKLFRSNQPTDMSVADYENLNDLHIATIVDLRTADERQEGPTEWVGEQAPQVVTLPMGSTGPFLELDALVEAAIKVEDVAALRTLGTEVYRRMPFEYAAELGMLLRSLADEESVPILIHCHAGKDRTGLAAALILSVLGVSRDTIMLDYLHSNDRLLNDGVERSPIEKMYWGVEAEWLKASYDAIEDQYGSVDRYIEVALSIDTATRALIRKNLLH